MNIKALHIEDNEVSAQKLFKGDEGSATAIQLQAHGILKEHTTKTPALLLCITGSVIYRDETKKLVELKGGDYVNIIPHVKHWLEGQKESQLILLK